VARGALLWRETRLDVIRVIRGVEIFQVAIHTGASGHLEVGAMAR